MNIDNAFWRFLFSWQRLRGIVVYALIFVVAGFFGNLWMTRDQASGVAEITEAVTLDGEKISFLPTLAESQKDKPALTLLYFFARWCPICKLQNATISGLAEDFNVIGIAMQSGSDAEVRTYLAQHSMTFAVVNDPSGRISQAYGVHGVPASFILDKDARIQFSTRGYATAAGLRSRLWLSQMAKQQ